MRRRTLVYTIDEWMRNGKVTGIPTIPRQNHPKVI